MGEEGEVGARGALWYNHQGLVRSHFQNGDAERLDNQTHSRTWQGIWMRGCRGGVFFGEKSRAGLGPALNLPFRMSGIEKPKNQTILSSLHRIFHHIMVFM